MLKHRIAAQLLGVLAAAGALTGRTTARRVALDDPLAPRRPQTYRPVHNTPEIIAWNKAVDERKAAKRGRK